jgi:hypothetical protein
LCPKIGGDLGGILKNIDIVVTGMGGFRGYLVEADMTRVSHAAYSNQIAPLQ